MTQESEQEEQSTGTNRTGLPVQRRTLLAAFGSIGVLAGGTGAYTRLTGEHTITRESRAVEIPPERAVPTGYEPIPDVEPITVERNKEVGPVSVNARVTNQHVQYDDFEVATEIERAKPPETTAGDGSDASGSEGSPTSEESDSDATPTPDGSESTATPTEESGATATPTPGEPRTSATPTPDRSQSTATPTPEESESTTPTPPATSTPSGEDDDDDGEGSTTRTPEQPEPTATPTPERPEPTATPVVETEESDPPDTTTSVVNEVGDVDTVVVGSMNIVTTPKVEILGQNFNEVSKSSLDELVKTRPELVRRLCGCELQDPASVSVTEVSDPLQPVSENADVYLISDFGRWNDELGDQPWITVAGTELYADDFVAMFIPDVEEKSLIAYCAIGTRVIDDSAGDAVFPAYVARRVVDPEHGQQAAAIADRGMSVVAPPPEPREENWEHEGLFGYREIGVFGDRFTQGLRISGVDTTLPDPGEYVD